MVPIQNPRWRAYDIVNDELVYSLGDVMWTVDFNEELSRLGCSPTDRVCGADDQWFVAQHIAPSQYLENVWTNIVVRDGKFGRGITFIGRSVTREELTELMPDQREAILAAFKCLLAAGSPSAQQMEQANEWHRQCSSNRQVMVDA